METRLVGNTKCIILDADGYYQLPFNHLDLQFRLHNIKAIRLTLKEGVLLNRLDSLRNQ